MSAALRNTTFALSAGLMLLVASATPAPAAQPQPLLINPGPSYNLPKFGFRSFNIAGVGERVTYVRWGSLAGNLGVEPGDILLSMNGFPLTYDGSWDQALYQAMVNGGWVQLAIVDVRTNNIAYRQTFVGGPIYGPGTPKSHIVAHAYHNQHGHGNGQFQVQAGPITLKSQVGPQANNGPGNIKTISHEAQLKALADAVKKGLKL